MKKWVDLKNISENICIIYYEDYINFIKNQTFMKPQDNTFITKLNTFFYKDCKDCKNYKNTSSDDIIEIKKVNCSKIFNKEDIDYYYYKKYMKYYTDEEITNIEKYLQE